MANQDGWRWCQKCQGFFFTGNPTQGVCPAGSSHDGNKSEPYAMLTGDGIFGAQSGWRWCQKCQGLFFSGNPSQGVCPTGGSHDASKSGHYSLLFGDGVIGTQGGWRWCQKCQGLFFSKNPSQGPCPAKGNHDGSASGPYAAPLENSGVSQLDFDTGVISFGNGVPVGGSAHLTIHSDGSYNFVGHFHKSSIIPYNYEVALGVVDSNNQLYTFAHQYSFSTGVADDNFPYSGNNAAISQNWSALVPGAAFSWNADSALNLGGLITTLEQAIEVAGPIIIDVIEIVAATA